MRKTLPEQIADRLRRRILRGTLAPGEAIKERDMAAEIAVSRTPMREAIRILAKEGLVILRPSRSPVVAKPSLKEITDSIEVLRALEVLSSELACERATEEEIASIQAINQKMSAIYDTTDMIDVFEIDMSFHRAIARASHNPALAETHQAYLARLWRVRYLSASERRSRERVLRQHDGIARGLQLRDAALVRSEVRAHLDALIDDIRQKYGEEIAARSGAAAE